MHPSSLPDLSSETPTRVNWHNLNANANHKPLGPTRWNQTLDSKLCTCYASEREKTDPKCRVGKKWTV